MDNKEVLSAIESLGGSCTFGQLKKHLQVEAIGGLNKSLRELLDANKIGWNAIRVSGPRQYRVSEDTTIFLLTMQGMRVYWKPEDVAKIINEGASDVYEARALLSRLKSDARYNSDIIRNVHIEKTLGGFHAVAD